MPYDKLGIGRHSQPGQAYFVTTVLDRGQRVFEDFACARLVIDRMRMLHEEGAIRSLAFVVMPDHVHWLFELGTSSLSDIVKRFKATTARNINTYLRSDGSLWQRGYYDRAIRQDEDLRQIARYIVANPLRAGLVADVGSYPHWDAEWLQDQDVSDLVVWGG